MKSLTARLWRGLMSSFFQFPKIWKYRLLSDEIIVRRHPFIHQPALFCSTGSVILRKVVHLGVKPSPLKYDPSIGLCKGIELLDMHRYLSVELLLVLPPSDVRTLINEAQG